MNKLQEFILNNHNWKELLSNPPYNLKIQQEDNLALFMYRTTQSDFNEEIVRLSRGCIIDIPTGKYICRPYDKFFNIGEGFADKIDFNTAVYEEKLDGSIIKLYFNPYEDKWAFATNGVINAENSQFSDSSNFMDIIKLTKEYQNIKVDNIPKSVTLIFELCSRYNRVVIDYDTPMLVLTGVRINKTGKFVDIHNDKIKNIINSMWNIQNIVKQYEINSIEEIPQDIEGCVIKDKNFHMVKVKNKWYVEMHHRINNHNLSFKELYLSGEADEIISYFKEYEDEYRQYEKECDKIFKEFNEAMNDVRLFIGSKDISNRDVKKQLAIYVNSTYPKYAHTIFKNLKYPQSITQIKEQLIQE